MVKQYNTTRSVLKEVNIGIEISACAVISLQFVSIRSYMFPNHVASIVLKLVQSHS